MYIIHKSLLVKTHGQCTGYNNQRKYKKKIRKLHLKEYFLMDGHWVLKII